MGFRPPKGVRPPQLEGKRTGRPRKSKNFASAWRDAIWGFEHHDEDYAVVPNAAAWLWWTFARYYPAVLYEFLKDFRKL